MTFRLSNRSYRRMEGVDPRLVAVVKEALRISNVDFGVAYMGGVRTAEEQLELFNKGRSRADGTKYKSKHQLGRAIDLIPFVEGGVDLSRQSHALTAAAMLEAAIKLNVKIKWGGHWRKLKDLPHFELVEDR